MAEPALRILQQDDLQAKSSLRQPFEYGTCDLHGNEDDFQKGGMPDKSAIAALSREEIDRMPAEELARVVRAVSLPFSRTYDETRLTMLGRDTLRRLAYLARRTCRNQGY